MKKWTSCILMAAMIASAGLALAEREFTKPAIKDCFGKALIGQVATLPAEDFAAYAKDFGSTRFLFVFHPCTATVALTLPNEAPDAETFWGKPVRFVLDETSLCEGYSPYPSPPLSAQSLLRPVSLEAFGGWAYGVVEAIDEKRIVLKLDEYSGLENAGESVTFLLDDKTEAYRGNWLEQTSVSNIHEIVNVGLSCELLYDVETQTALILWEANG